jgi:hypothetical protein
LTAGPMPKLTEGTFALGGLAVFTLWLFVGLPILNSPSPIYHQQGANPGEPPQKTAGDPKGTAQSPFFVQVIPTPKTAEERSQEADEREEKKSADRWLVRWTAILAFATLGLIGATGLLGYFALRQARDTRASIDLARNEFISTHRPRVKVRRVQVHILEVGKPFEVSYRVINTGETAANILEMNGTILFINGDLPAVPEYDPANTARFVPRPGSGLNSGQWIENVATTSWV